MQFRSLKKSITAILMLPMTLLPIGLFTQPASADFIFVPAEDNRRIPERQYAINPDIIGFNRFTSCVGIVALLKNKDLIGLHMALFDEDDKQFGEDPNDVPRILELLKDREKVIIVGDESCWEGDQTFSKAYRELKEKLGNPDVIKAEQKKRARGVYHAKKVGGDIKVMVCIESEPKPKQGQTSRSSDNFSSNEPSIVGEKDTPIKFTLPDGISVKIADDNRNAKDPAVFTEVKNGREEKNPGIDELYVADPMNAKENFFVCIEKV